LGAAPVDQTFSITKLSQTITFAPLSDRTIADPPFAISATASSGLAVTFVASGACTLSGNTVTLTAIGTCTIRASQAGNDTYAAAADVTHSFNIDINRVFVASVQNSYILP
jgi:hypothetical protein